MKFSRRHFFYGAACVAAAAAMPSSLNAIAESERLYPPIDLSYFDSPLSTPAGRLKIGYAAITWGGKDALAIDDISSLGYPGIQLRANVVQEFPEPTTVRAMLDRHHLKFAAISSGVVTLDPSQRNSSLAMHEANAKYIKAAGGTLLQLIGTPTRGRTFTADDYKREGQLLTEIAKRVSDYGVRTGFHNHMGTIGQSPQQVEQILDASDPNYVKLELDTGHYQQGGGNPAKAIQQYSDRLLFLHLKDVKPAPTRSGYEFTELGQGTVDFPAVFSALQKIRFRGWAIVELDGEQSGVVRTPKQSAEMSKQYLKKLGVSL